MKVKIFYDYQSIEEGNNNNLISTYESGLKSILKIPPVSEESDDDFDIPPSNDLWL